jgi:heme exporter protein B
MKAAGTQASLWGQLAAHFRKELLLEWRSRDAINGMLFFSLLVIVVFSLAFDPTQAQSREIAGGVLWVALLFAIVVALNQAWMREARNSVLDGLRISPADPAMLFLGKALANFTFVTTLELIATPVFVVFYNLHPLGETWKLLLLLPLATWALVCNGTFFAALSLRTRSREMMLPLVLFPLSLPCLLAAVQGTTNVLTGNDSPDLWLKLLACYDVIFTTASLLLFGTILNAE